MPFSSQHDKGVMLVGIFRTKSIEEYQSDVKSTHLRREMGALDVTMLGIGVIVGTGIFVLTGVAAAKYAGPALMVSFLMAGITCGFVSLVYSELASMVSVAGSAYAYAYASVGELWAWLVGWNLVLEYSVGASAVAGGWSAYVTGLLNSMGFAIPEYLTKVPAEGGLVNLPAVLITLFLTVLLIKGIHASVTVNKVLVGVKLLAIFIFLFLAGPSVDTANWEPFLPFGWAGVSAGAAVIFFAYLGVDSIATAAEETKNPARDMPVGIIASLLICTLLYVGVTAVMTGNMSYTQLDNAEPVAFVLRELGYRFDSQIHLPGASALQDPAPHHHRGGVGGGPGQRLHAHQRGSGDVQRGHALCLPGVLRGGDGAAQKVSNCQQALPLPGSLSGRKPFYRQLRLHHVQSFLYDLGEVLGMECFGSGALFPLWPQAQP